MSRVAEVLAELRAKNRRRRGMGPSSVPPSGEAAWAERALPTLIKIAEAGRKGAAASEVIGNRGPKRECVAWLETAGLIRWEPGREAGRWVATTLGEMRAKGAA